MGGNPQSGAGRLRDAPRSLEVLRAQVGAGPRPTSLHPTPQAPAKPPGPWRRALTPLLFSPAPSFPRSQPRRGSYSPLQAPWRGRGSHQMHRGELAARLTPSSPLPRLRRPFLSPSLLSLSIYSSLLYSYGLSSSPSCFSPPRLASLPVHTPRSGTPQKTADALRRIPASALLIFSCSALRRR